MNQTAPAAIEENEPECIEATVPEHVAGRRFDQALAEMFPEFSRSRLTEWIKSGDALLDGEIVKPKVAVNGGETVTLAARQQVETDAVAENIPLEVLYADADVLVVNKPAGLVVHPGAGNPRGTMVNALLHYDPELAQLPRAGIVHRLDKDTSGLMVVARTRAAMDALVRMIAAREVQRQYLAIGHRGWPGTPERVVEAAIGRDPGHRLRMAVVDLSRQPGKTARTTFQCLDQNAQACLVRCILHTGRTHQIRVHMAHIGHPLLGDGLYGGTSLAGMERQALHAWRLAFAHPFTGAAQVWTAALPEDMQQALQALGLRYNEPD